MLPKKHIAALCAVLAVVFGVYLFQGGRGQEIAAIGATRIPEIVAHRGDSVNAPDNTLPAFELAALEHPAWVELDVQQTKDGVILVSHDDDLQRVSSEKLFIHDLTYDETQQLDVGSWFSKEFSYVRLSTLDSILKLYKDSGTRVMVEIKYTGFGDHIEESVLEIINENEMHDQTLIISTHPGTLERIKELDPSMITCYTMFVAWEHIEDIPFADYYTVEEGNIDPSLVENVHNAGGRIYAWTVNNQETVQYLIDCGVDGMLTDNPILMKRVIEDAKYDTGLLRALRIFLDELRQF
jgi:glycerophosphoryl diester phosphodiesterase